MPNVHALPTTRNLALERRRVDLFEHVLGPLATLDADPPVTLDELCEALKTFAFLCEIRANSELMRELFRRAGIEAVRQLAPAVVDSALAWARRLSALPLPPREARP